MDGGFDAGGASVYSEAKGEYTKQLLLFITPAFHRFYMTCLSQAAAEEPQVKRQLWKFQELLSQIPDWNLDKVHREVSKLVSEIQCDYLEELVTAVFIAHTKVLTAIRIGNKNKRVQITIPKLEHFLHRSLSECSRLLWTSAYLFHSEITAIEKQKNHRQIEQLIHEGISQAIRGLLPVKNILKDYLMEADDAEDADNEEDDDEKDEKGNKNQTVDAEPKQTVDAPTVIASPIVVEESHGDSNEHGDTAEIQQQLEDSSAQVQAQIPDAVVEDTRTIVTDADVQHTNEVADAQPVVAQSTPPPANPVIPTLVVDTEPSVRFTNFDQVIQEHGHGTSIGYVEKDRDAEDDEDNIEFLDDEGESLTEFEDLTEGAIAPLDADDFESL